MRFAAAILFALAVVAAQAAHGGFLVPFLAYPTYALLCLGVLCALPLAIRSSRPSWAWPMVSGFALAGYALWRCAHEPDATLATMDGGLILAGVSMWAGVSLALNRNDARFTFVTICLVAACLQVGVAVVQLVKPEEFSQPYWLSQELHDIYATRFIDRPHGLFMNPNHFAWLMNAMALMALSLGIWGRVRVVSRIALLYLAAVFSAMCILSGSRGGTLSLLAGFSTFLALSLVALIGSVRHRRFLIFGLGTVALVICAGSVYLAYSTSWVAQGRLDAVLEPQVRGAFFEEAIRLFQTQPLFGVGPGIFRYAARLYRVGQMADDPIFAHDDWLQFGAEYGFIGVALLVIFALLVLAAGARGFLALVHKASTETGNAFSSSGAFVLGALCALVATAVHGNVDFNMHIPANALLAAALIALVTSACPTPAASSASRFRPDAWLTVLAGLAAMVALLTLLDHRGEADYRSLEAANAFARDDVGRALGESEKGLRQVPADPTLLALRGRGLFEYEAWLQATTPGKMVKVAADQDTADTAGSKDENQDTSEEVPTVLLTPAESAKNFRDSAESYAAAVQAEPLERLYHIGRARALGALNLDQKAVPEFIEAIRLDPDHSYPWGKYGDFLLDQGQTAAARRIFAIGATLGAGEYSQSQVEAIDEDLAPQDEQEKSP